MSSRTCLKTCILLALILLGSGFTIGYIFQRSEIQRLQKDLSEVTEDINYVKGIPYKIEISATSSHVANGKDFSKVVINVKNIFNEPVSGANISVLLKAGEDYKKSFTTIDHGNGTYTTAINSTMSGIFDVIALDIGTGISAFTTVEFVAGPTEKVEIVGFTHPRDEKPRNKTTVYAVALDKYGNIVKPP